MHTFQKTCTTLRFTDAFLSTGQNEWACFATSTNTHNPTTRSNNGTSYEDISSPSPFCARKSNNTISRIRTRDVEKWESRTRDLLAANYRAHVGAGETVPARNVELGLLGTIRAHCERF